LHSLWRDDGLPSCPAVLKAFSEVLTLVSGLHRV
jgi:hypothetical protein